MKRYSLALLAFVCLFATSAHSEEINLEAFIGKYDYQSRLDMKISATELLKLIKENKAQLVDIRFKEETDAWRMGFSTNIPLPELPARLNELSKDKLIVTACPHMDRSTIAMLYLKTKGYNVKYLQDGLLGLADHLRGDNAKAFSK